jgi:toxin-antitoxin system PIN domain toxin
LNLCDVNVWLALTLSKHVHHRTCRSWLQTVHEPASVLFCRATQQALLRLLTNAVVLAPYGNPPLSNKEAWSVYESFLRDGRVLLRTEEPPGLEPLWKSLALRSAASPKLWADAYLAAFAVKAGCTMVTTDTSFRQFPGLELRLLS